ncbi:hypothetical protein PIB30_049619 [Stylosanthes scabra]|uniref:Uncharacterized protein n=1 Tax=Stylosanthes scabra TaxID=79078 RepID=A0ABU6YJU3_9FABA|nr:hypothetical protein [Stylosanthes scabra]
MEEEAGWSVRLGNRPVLRSLQELPRLRPVLRHRQELPRVVQFCAVIRLSQLRRPRPPEALRHHSPAPKASYNNNSLVPWGRLHGLNDAIELYHISCLQRDCLHAPEKSKSKETNSEGAVNLAPDSQDKRLRKREKGSSPVFPFWHSSTLPVDTKFGTKIPHQSL